MFNYSSSSPTITNCTFSGNSADTGGGMDNYNSSSPTITNCIMWGDTAPAGPEIYNNASTPTVTYSDIEGGCAATGSTCGAGNIALNPNFVVGPDGVYYLNQSTSPCVNAGSDFAVNIGLDTMTTDPLGSPDVGIVDMGYHYPIP